MGKRFGRKATGDDSEANIEASSTPAQATGREFSIRPAAENDDEEEKSPNPPAAPGNESDNTNGKAPEAGKGQTITWATDLKQPSAEKALRIPPPLQRDNGAPLQEVDEITSDDDDLDKSSLANASGSSGLRRRRSRRLSTAATSMSIERIASSMFVLGETQEGARSRSREPNGGLHHQNTERAASATREDRKSSLQNLSKEELGGIEYRSLRLLLKIIVGGSQSAFNPPAKQLTICRIFRRPSPARSDLSRALDT